MSKHEERTVGHIGGRKEYMGVCVCGSPWPCVADRLARAEEENEKLVAALDRIAGACEALGFIRIATEARAAIAASKGPV